MDGKTGGGRFSHLGGCLPPVFEMRSVVVAPGCERAYDQAEWRGALVVVERGEIELECERGTRRRFGRGSVLWMSGLPLRALRNSGPEPALLVAVSRRLSDERLGRSVYRAGEDPHGHR